MEKHVTISAGNLKMGSIKSVSLPPVITCVKCECNKKCYARRMMRYKQTKESWFRNLELLKIDPDTYWREIEGTIMMERAFRFHVSGDIVDLDYMKRMAGIAARNSHCQIICFTKKFDIVNQFIKEGGVISDNLHLIFSGWKGLEMNNPYNFPECHVIFKNGETTARDGAKYCSGNCSECFKENKNCFNLKKGEQILIKEH